MTMKLLPDQAIKKTLRSSAVKARNSLTEESRIHKSVQICERISGLPAYQEAAKVMLYKWTRGEVKLDALEKGGIFYDNHKTFLYPLCADNENLLAIKPDEGEDSWAPGALGILEPVREKGEIAVPEEIDLILCPLAGFDEDLTRLGMGSGYYDRFLPMCKNAVKIGIAFDTQRLCKIPAEPHDIKMDMIITESRIWLR